MYQGGDSRGCSGYRCVPGALHIAPCIPKSWPKFEAIVKTEGAEFRITVENPDHVSSGVRSIEVNGATIEGDIPAVGMTGAHVVRVVLGTKGA
jgi:cellobiose phosphorylase